MTTAIPFSLWTVSAPPPPPGCVVAAVLAFGDLCEARDLGLCLIRISETRLACEDMRLLLDAAERERALDVAILWDPARAEMVRVIDERQPDRADRRLHGFPRLMRQAA